MMQWAKWAQPIVHYANEPSLLCVGDVDAPLLCLFLFSFGKLALNWLVGREQFQKMKPQQFVRLIRERSFLFGIPRAILMVQIGHLLMFTINAD